MNESGLIARRIGFDARYLSHGMIGGVHTYVRNLVPALCRLGDNRQVVLYADAKAPFEMGDLPTAVSVRILPWRNATSSVMNDFLLGRTWQQDRVAVAHTPANYGFAPAALPLVVTLHDAINLLPLTEILRDDAKNPRHVTIMTYLHVLTIAAMRRKPFVITDSHYCRKEILRHSSLPADRIHVIHLAHESDVRPLDVGEVRDLRDRLRLRPKVLLADAIKNPACTLRAYRALPEALRNETSLLFFSRRPPARAVREAADKGECLLLVRPSRGELIQLYNLADLFIFPSWYEGFGLPVLEAMACGTPVIASSRCSLPEIIGDGGIVVDAEDHLAFARSIVELLTRDSALARLRQAALSRAECFSWEQTARQTLEVYDEAFRRWQHPITSRRRTHTAIWGRS